MTRRLYASSLLLLAIIAVLILMPRAAAAQTTNTSASLDTIAGDYDVLPDITYRTANNTTVKLDLYLPRTRASVPVPVVMFIHGGGWVAGRKEQDVLLLLPYMNMGFAVANVEYRLGRDSLAPAAVEDTRCALRWIARNAAQHKLDASKIVLTGFSAGGHLSLITGLLPAGSAFDRTCPTEEAVRWNQGTEPRVSVAAIVNWYGITDVGDLLAGANAKHYAIEWFGSREDRSALARQVSPLTYVRAGVPPVLSIHGDADDVVPYAHSTRLHAELEKVGVPNKLVTIRGGKHGGFGRRDVSDFYVAVREFLGERGLLAQMRSVRR